MKKLIAVALFAAAPMAVMAQDAAQDATLAPPACKKPVLPTSNIRKADGNDDFNEKFQAYQDCIKVYVDTQNKLANAHISAANAAVNDANAYVKELNEKQGKN